MELNRKTAAFSGVEGSQLNINSCQPLNFTKLLPQYSATRSGRGIYYEPLALVWKESQKWTRDMLLTLWIWFGVLGELEVDDSLA
jgi:hypothetical protein